MVFAKKVSDPERFGVVDFDENMKAISIEKALNLRLQPTDFVKDDIRTVDNFAKFLKRKAEE